MAGEIRKAISVVKKRSGMHEKAIRPFSIGTEGITVGPPLKEFRGVFSGTPEIDTNASAIPGDPLAPDEHRQ
jgi:circadian clock protein KaiC